VGRRKSEKKVK
jgi:hypothetical protein